MSGAAEGGCTKGALAVLRSGASPNFRLGRRIRAADLFPVAKDLRGGSAGRRGGACLRLRVEPKKRMNMKRAVILTVCLLAGFAALAQTERRQARMQAEQTRASERDRVRRERAQADSIAYLRALRSLERREFALEADRLTLRRGGSMFVSSDTNFVTLSGDMATVQVAPFLGGGPNGVGGITLEGQASDIRMQRDKRGAVTFSMNVFGRGISAILNIRLPEGGNSATVSIDPNFSGNRIVMNGILIPLDDSRAFKGTAF